MDKYKRIATPPSIIDIERQVNLVGTSIKNWIIGIYIILNLIALLKSKFIKYCI